MVGCGMSFGSKSPDSLVNISGFSARPAVLTSLQVGHLWLVELTNPYARSALSAECSFHVAATVSFEGIKTRFRAFGLDVAGFDKRVSRVAAQGQLLKLIAQK